MKIRLANPIQSDSIVDGEGLRTVIWTQGCSHNCPGCHNQRTHSFTGGFLKEIDELKEEIRNLKNQDGITLSGGDPMFQIDACLEIAEFCQSQNLNVWCYTGFTFEQLLVLAANNPNLLKLLKNIDVLVDGRFKLEEKSFDVQFRGSKNQRIIDVQKSLKENKAIEIPKYKVKEENDYLPSYQKEQYMFI